LYRFGSEDGKWWYGHLLLDEMKSDFFEVTLSGSRVKDPAKVILANPRSGLAVSHEWNKFVWFSTMTLIAGDEVVCWVGSTAAQPEWQSKPDGRILHGGLNQYLIYDVGSFPFGRVTRKPVANLWSEFSRSVSRF
jgi:hypothetical protein